MHVDNDHAAFGFNRQFRIRRDRFFDLSERRPVLCPLTTNTDGEWKRITREKTVRKGCRQDEKIVEDDS